MCNATGIEITTSSNSNSSDNQNSDNHSSHSETKTMPMVMDDNAKKGPFADYASKEVLSKLGQFQDSVESSYQQSLPQNKLVAASQPASDETATPMMPSGINWKDVSIENVLGEGGFSFIFKVRLETPLKDNGENEFALKCLKAKAITNEEDLEFNAMDLYTESYLLSRLSHEHIIGIHGVMEGSLSDSYLSDGYFILLDIMETTLFDALEVWRESESRQKKSKSAIAVRVQNVILPIVEAMQYLHQHDIVLRDLKPENIGFDQSGRAKLFDFGLARHISVLEDGDMAGSICYMAPEVMLKESVSFSCDVYSFAIVLWEVCTLQVPLSEFGDFDEVERRVARGNWRPPTRWIPSKTLRNLISDCWNRDPKARPNFISIERTLQKSCNKDGSKTPTSRLSGLKRMNSIDALSASFSEIYSEVLRNNPRKGRQSSIF